MIIAPPAKSILVALAAVVACVLSGPATAADRYAIPYPLPFSYSEGQTAPRTEVRDPSIIREGDTYYLVFTMYPFSNRGAFFARRAANGSRSMTARATP